MSVQQDSDRLRGMVTSVMRGDIPREAYLRERRLVIDALAVERSTTPLPEVPARKASGISDTMPVLKSTATSGVTHPMVDAALDSPAAPGNALDPLIGIVVVAVALLAVGLLVAAIW